jgi:hypothetical protein
MLLTRRQVLLFRKSLVVSLFTVSAISIGCGPEGAGSIHINSPKSKQEMIKIGAGDAPTLTATPGPRPKSRSTSKKGAQKIR